MTRAESQANLVYPEDIIDASPLAAYPNWIDRNLPFREGFVNGYEQAEKDILSKFTKEHLEGLRWIERSGITSQPTPYHKYCKDLYKVLEELLKEKYDIQGDTSI